MEENQTRGNTGKRNEFRQATMRVRRGCAKVPVLACCYFVLSIGAFRWSTVEASSNGVRFLTPSAVLSGSSHSVPLALFSRLDGQRGDGVGEEDAEGWPTRRFRRSPAGDLILSPPPMAALMESAGEGAETSSNVNSGSPWALIALREYPGGKRHSLSFTPRLGRDSGEEKEEDTFLEVEEEEEDEEDDNNIVGGGIFHKRRTPPFAPRMGRRVAPKRRVIPFAPRLGRRRLRGVAGGEEVPSPSTGNPDRNLIFSPRLGRSTKQVGSDGPRSEGDRRGSTEDGATKDV